MGKSPAGRDLRKYARNTTIQLFFGGVLLLLIVGNGLIWWIYGYAALRISLLCMLVFSVPVVLAIVGLLIMDWVVKKNIGD